MRKISLKLETLSVETFATAPAPARTGTVQGHQLSGGPACLPTR